MSGPRPAARAGPGLSLASQDLAAGLSRLTAFSRSAGEVRLLDTGKAYPLRPGRHVLVALADARTDMQVNGRDVDTSEDVVLVRAILDAAPGPPPAGGTR